MARLKHLRHQRSVRLRGLRVACHTCHAEREFHWPLLLKHPISDRLQSSSDRAVWGTKIKDRIYPRRRRVEPCPHKFRLTGGANSTLGGQLSEAHLPRSGHTTAKATSRAHPGSSDTGGHGYTPSAGAGQLAAGLLMRRSDPAQTPPKASTYHTP